MIEKVDLHVPTQQHEGFQIALFEESVSGDACNHRRSIEKSVPCSIALRTQPEIFGRARMVFERNMLRKVVACVVLRVPCTPASAHTGMLVHARVSLS